MKRFFSIAVIAVLVFAPRALAQTVPPAKEDVPRLTYLLFPFVVFDQNWDTGIAISNTTAVPAGVGTTGESRGEVVMCFFPMDGLEVFTATLDKKELSAGQTGVFLGSSLKRSFSGYMIAVCGFSAGHGYAFTDSLKSALPSISQGYVAVAISPRKDLSLKPNELK